MNFNNEFLDRVGRILDGRKLVVVDYWYIPYATCIGNPEPKFISHGEAKKNGQFLSQEREVVAYVDSIACVVIGEQQYACTIRCSTVTGGHIECMHQHSQMLCLPAHLYNKMMYIILICKNISASCKRIE